MCENSEQPHGNENSVINGQATAANFIDCSIINVESPVQISERTSALSCNVWETFLDKDGRVVNESALRKAVFKGIIHCTCASRLRITAH